VCVCVLLLKDWSVSVPSLVPDDVDFVAIAFLVVAVVVLVLVLVLVLVCCWCCAEFGFTSSFIS